MNGILEGIGSIVSQWLAVSKHRVEEEGSELLLSEDVWACRKAEVVYVYLFIFLLGNTYIITGSGWESNKPVDKGTPIGLCTCIVGQSCVIMSICTWCAG